MLNLFQTLRRGPFIWVLFVAVALLAVVAYWYFAQSGARGETTVTVTRGDLRATVTANARVRAQESVRLAFPLSGLVSKVNVQEGDTVKKGDVLVELDPREVQRRVRQAEMNLAAREQDLAQAQAPPAAADLEIAQQTLKKAALALAAAEDRYDEEPTEQNRLARELAQSDYEIARANFERQTQGAGASQLDDLRRAVENARLELQAAHETLNDTRLHAPFDGTITEVTAQTGERVGGYNPVIALADLTRLEAVADIDEIDVAEVREGQTVELRFDAFPGESVKGKLTRLFPAANTDRGATVYRAIIALDPTPLKLRPGMGATVQIATVEKTNVLRVPSRAIKNAGSQKIVVVKDGAVTRNVVIETGLSDGNQTEVLSGVPEGAVLVIE